MTFSYRNIAKTTTKNHCHPTK